VSLGDGYRYVEGVERSDPQLPGLRCLRRIDDSRLGEWRGPAADPEPGLAPKAPSEDEVYLVRRIDGDQELAVRVYGRPLSSPRSRLRFEQEIGALKALADVPHVMPVLDAGVTADDRAYVVMDFCPSGSLQDHLFTVGRFTPLEARRIGSKLAAALDRTHERDIVHRNVKPSSVLIDAHGEPALSSFGLVTLAVSDGDFGPPLPPRPRPFLAPEAYLPELMNPATDVFSLGATLYTMLAGWAPRTIDPLAITVDGENIADLPRVPFALMAVVRKAMAIDPRDRYPDAMELQAALAHAV
jgi:serine/threonine protein kinase